MRYFYIFSLIFSFVIPSIARDLLAQEAVPQSTFDEGAETVLHAEEITDDIRQWAQNTALKLKDFLLDLKKLDTHQKRKSLVKVIQECVVEAKDTRELLLMRFSLNRALKLESLFSHDEDGDALAVNYILLPSVKQSIFIYENADLPYLTANKDKTGEIEPPPYAAFTKANIGYLLTASNMHKTLEGQLEVLKLAIVWVTNDLLRSPEAKRNPVNARLILKLQSLDQEIKETPTMDPKLISRTRSILLIASLQIEKEKSAVTILSFPQFAKSQNDTTQVFNPEPQDTSSLKSPFNKKLSYIKFVLATGATEGEVAFHGGLEFFTVNDPYRGGDPRYNPSFNNILKLEGDFRGDELYRWDGEILTLAVPYWFALGNKNNPLVAINPNATFLKQREDNIRNFGDQRVLNYGLTFRFLPEVAKNLLRMEASASTARYTAGFMLKGDQSLITQEWKDYYLAQKGKPPKGNLMKNGADFDDSIMLEAKCQLKATANYPGDITFECGGFYNKRNLNFSKDNDIQISPYRNQVDTATQRGMYFTLEIGIPPDHPKNKTEEVGWTSFLGGTLRFENDELPSELMTLFNPEEAKKMDQSYDSLFLYLRFDF